MNKPIAADQDRNTPACLPMTDDPETGSLQQFKFVLQNAGIGMLRITADNLIREANDVFANMLGYSPAELSEESYLSLLTTGEMEAVARDHAMILVGARCSLTTERRFLSKCGKVVMTRETMTRVDTTAQTPEILALYQDITGQSTAEQELDDKSQELRSFVESAEALSKELAHDFKNLLMIVACNAEIIGDRTEDSRILSSVKQINDASHRAVSLTQRLSILSRIGS